MGLQRCEKSLTHKEASFVSKINNGYKFDKRNGRQLKIRNIQIRKKTTQVYTKRDVHYLGQSQNCCMNTCRKSHLQLAQLKRSVRGP